MTNYTTEDILKNVAAYIQEECEKNYVGRSNVDTTTLAKIRQDGNEILASFGLPIEIFVYVHHENPTQITLTFRDKEQKND